MCTVSGLQYNSITRHGESHQKTMHLAVAAAVGVGVSPLSRRTDSSWCSCSSSPHSFARPPNLHSPHQ